MDINENAPGNLSQQAVTRGTDNETGHDPRNDEDNIPLQTEDDAPLEEYMLDVDAADSVASEHPDN